MFTGLIETTGRTLHLAPAGGSTELALAAPALSPELLPGDSLAVNGCCLTVARVSGQALYFDLLHETLALTNLGELTLSQPVNLERPIPASGRLGGHFVQGHIDCATRVRSVTEHGHDLGLTFDLPPEFARYIAAKGSIAINGVSLTVAAVNRDHFTIWIIPHTRSHTNLGQLIPGAAVNLEFDILAKYTERILTASQ
jgi:riboflavin synthase